MVRESDVMYRRTHQGAWVLSAFVDGYLVSRQYMGYGKREASRMFRDEFNS